MYSLILLLGSDGADEELGIHLFFYCVVMVLTKNYVFIDSFTV